MPAPEIIQTLVQQFQDNRDSYRSARYNEAQLRQEFLNPFFNAVGWDRLIRVDYHGTKKVPTGTCYSILKAAGIKHP